MDVSIVDYSPKFKPLIFDLFEKTFQRKMSKEFWEWRFEKNPFGKPIIKLAFYKDKLVSNYIASPLQIVKNGRCLPLLHSMTTMTDPNFSGHGISSDLANETYKVGKDLGYKAVMGFANNISHHMFIKKLGFCDLNTMNELTITNFQTSVSKLVIKEILNFNEIPDDFYSEIINAKKFSIKRDSNYLNWRFMLNPENKYYCYNIIKNNEIYGYFILKVFNGIKCHIVDFLLKDEIDCYKSMIDYSKTFCKKLNLNVLTLWTNNENLMHMTDVKKLDSTIGKTYFILKMLNEDDKDLTNFKNWNITMADSDVF